MQSFGGNRVFVSSEKAREIKDGFRQKIQRVIKSLGIIFLILLFIAIGAGIYIFFHYPIGLPRDRIVRQEYLPFKSDDTPLSQAELIEEDTAYIYLSGFSDSIYFQNVLEHIEQYKNDGIKNYIIDVRKNAGGEYELVQALLEAVGVKAPEYDRIIRFSPFAQQQKGYFRTRGTLRIKGSRDSYKGMQCSCMCW